MINRRRPGEVRDAILRYLDGEHRAATVAEIRSAVQIEFGRVAASSVRSYLALNADDGGTFERVSRGRYRLRDT